MQAQHILDIYLYVLQYEVVGDQSHQASLGTYIWPDYTAAEYREHTCMEVVWMTGSWYACHCEGVNASELLSFQGQADFRWLDEDYGARRHPADTTVDSDDDWLPQLELLLL